MLQCEEEKIWPTCKSIRDHVSAMRTVGISSLKLAEGLMSGTSSPNVNWKEGTHDLLQIKLSFNADHICGMMSRRSSLAQHTTWSSKSEVSECTASAAILATAW